MRRRALRELQDREQFDVFVEALRRGGWHVVCEVDGPDARSWEFGRGQESVLLVFDDLLGGSLKTESESVDLDAVASRMMELM